MTFEDCSECPFKQIYNQKSKQCECPPEKKYFTGQECIACFHPKFFDFSDKTCKYCPNKQIYDVKLQKCIPCPEDYPLFSGDECVKCPPNTYYNKTTL